MTPISPLATAEEASRQLADSDARWLVAGCAQLERALRARLNDRAVGHGVRERQAELDDVSAGAFQSRKEIESGGWRWMAGRHIRNERAPSRRTQLRELLGYALR